MKNLKFLFVAVILTCFVGVTQTMAQAYSGTGTESDAYEPYGPKPVAFEMDGVQYFAWAEMEFKWVITPSLNINWVSHGQIVEVHLGDQFGEIVEDFKFKKAVRAIDTRGYEDKIIITPGGKVNVNNHAKDFIH